MPARAGVSGRRAPQLEELLFPTRTAAVVVPSPPLALPCARLLDSSPEPLGGCCPPARAAIMYFLAVPARVSRQQPPAPPRSCCRLQPSFCARLDVSRGAVGGLLPTIAEPRARPARRCTGAQLAATIAAIGVAIAASSGS